MVGTDMLRGGSAQKLRLVLGVGLEHTLDIGGDDGELGAVEDNCVHEVCVVSNEAEE